jgi:hypothetical protein
LYSSVYDRGWRECLDAALGLTVIVTRISDMLSISKEVQPHHQCASPRQSRKEIIEI